MINKNNKNGETVLLVYIKFLIICKMKILEDTITNKVNLNSKILQKQTIKLRKSVEKREKIMILNQLLSLQFSLNHGTMITR